VRDASEFGAAGSTELATPSTVRAGDRGETLIELLVAMLIMGVGVVTLLGGMATGVRMSVIYHEQALAGTQVRAYAESIESSIYASPSGYTDCATTLTYGLSFIPAPNYTASITSITYWDGTSTFVPTCTTTPTDTDTGIQELTLAVSNINDGETESLVIIIRRPCRSLADFSLDPPCS
jgi:prepilin-type N-terminal cleavage/methylation domain-containing protein